MNLKKLFEDKTRATSRAVAKPLLSSPSVFASAFITSLPPVFGTSNIGRLAVNLVANRLLAAGAEPRYLSGAVSIDMDFPRKQSEAVAMGLADGAVQAEAEWATIDVQVLETGPASGLSVALSGIGSKMPGISAPGRCPEKGDCVIVTGPLGATGAAIAGAERGMEVLVENSDGTPLIEVMRAVYAHSCGLPAVAFPADGIETELHRLGVKANIDRSALPVDNTVLAACELMGLDPLKLAGADAMLLITPPDRADGIVEAVRRYSAGSRAAIIGRVE